MAQHWFRAVILYVALAIPAAVLASNRTVPFQVIGAGYGRTGTKSFHRALELLNITPVYDFNMAQRPILENKLLAEQLRIKKPSGFIHKFQEGIWRTAEEWDLIFGDFAACVDSPCNFVAAELAHVYPEAKVVLTVRDSPEVWFKSYNETVMDRERSYISSWSWLIMTRLRRWAGLTPRGYDSPVVRLFREENSPVLRVTAQNYVDFHNSIRKHVPSDRLLEFNVKEGWGPLCEFLGKPVPNVPFPHVNDRKAFREWTHKIVRDTEDELHLLLVVLSAVGAFVTLLGAVYYLYKR